MAFNNFPYTDFHELNIDWVLKNVKDAMSQVNTLGVDVKNLDEFVKNYLQTQATDAAVKKVLDEWLDNGTISSIVAQYVDGLGPTYTIAFMGREGSNIGLSAVLHLSNSGKTFIFDFSNEQDGATLRGYLKSNGYRTIDGLVLSHYHYDHFGGLQSLLSDSYFDFSNCIAYLPGIPDFTRWQGTYANVETNINIVTGLLSYNAIPSVVVANGDAVPTGEPFVTITGYGNNVNFFNQYYSWTKNENLDDISVTNYNNFCNCFMIRSYSGNTFISADLEGPAEENIAQYVMDANIYQVEHHGLNYETRKNYLTALSPEFAIICSYGAPWERVANVTPHPTAEKLITMSDYKVTGYNGTVIYTVGNGQILVNSGVNAPAAIVDKVTLAPGATIQDGTNVNNLAPGVYTVQNAPHAATIANTPKNTGGYRLEKKVTTNTEATVDIAYSANTTKGEIFIRNKNSDGVFYPWMALVSGRYYIKDLTSTDITVPTSYFPTGGHVNRLVMANSFLTLSLRFTTVNEIPYNTNILNLPITDFTFSGSYLFGCLVGLTNGNIYPVVVEPDGGRLTLHNYKVVPAGEQVVLNLTGDMYWNISTQN